MCKHSIILKAEYSISKATLDKIAKENPSIKGTIFDFAKVELTNDIAEQILNALQNNIADTTDITNDDLGTTFGLRVEILSGLRYDVCDTSRVRENR